jgi:hypothetical protein
MSTLRTDTPCYVNHGRSLRPIPVNSFREIAERRRRRLNDGYLRMETVSAYMNLGKAREFRGFQGII